jgi:hypothetical protein
VALISGGLTVLFAGWAYDDPFITYRYADNLSRGLGLVYNLGEQVLSTTTPLFALLLAALHPVWPDLHSLAVLTGALSLAAGGLCLWDLASHPRLMFTRWAGLLFYPLFPLVDSTLSSETPLYLALCLGAMVSYKRQRYRLTALIAALAALTRPDGVLVAVILGLHYIWTQWPRQHGWRQRVANLPWQALLIYLGLGLGWVSFAWAYYGSPIPVTLFTKQQQAVVEGSQTFLPGFATILSWYSAWAYQAEAVLSLPGLVYGLLRLPTMRWLAAWTGLYFVAYALLGVTRYFWYYAPLAPVFILGLGLGIDALAEGLRWVGRGERAREGTTEVVTTMATTMANGRVSRVLPGMVLVVLLGGQIDRLWQMHQAPDPRFEIYQASGEWLRANTPPEASVGALEVGIIGYYAQRPMVDFAGLIQPEIAEQLGTSASYGSAAAWAIERYQPDYLVVHRGRFPELEAEFLPACQQQVNFPGAEYNYNFDISIYACP